MKAWFIIFSDRLRDLGGALCSQNKSPHSDCKALHLFPDEISSGSYRALSAEVSQANQMYPLSSVPSAHSSDPESDVGERARDPRGSKAHRVKVHRFSLESGEAQFSSRTY